MSVRRWCLCGAALMVAGVWVTTGAAQAPAARLTMPIVTTGAPPGVDNGLREAPSRRIDAAAAAARLHRPLVDRPYLDGSVIVKFRPGTGMSARRAMLALVNGAQLPPAPYANFDLIAIADDADPEAAARRLAAQADVEYAQARYRMRPAFVPNDPLYERQWNLPVLDMERAWDINPGASAAITVAVLDTGIAFADAIGTYRVTNEIAQSYFPGQTTVDVPFAAAPDLGANRMVAPRDLIWNTAYPFDLHGHGTHVAGTIGQLTNNSTGTAGMAFNVRIMPVKVLSSDWDAIFSGDTLFGTDDIVAEGIRYAVDNGARVLNMSLGRSGPAAPVVDDALRYAVSHGAFVAVAAGNEYLDGNPVQHPADLAPSLDGLVAVGAIGRNRSRAIYSNTGSYVELVAPGGDQVRNGITGGILQQMPDFDFAFAVPPRFDIFTYEYLQGTSMATPHVAGFAALLMQQGITSPAAIEAAMKRYATDLGASGRDDEYGAGLIDPRATLRGIGLAR